MVSAVILRATPAFLKAIVGGREPVEDLRLSTACEVADPPLCRQHESDTLRGVGQRPTLLPLPHGCGGLTFWSGDV